MKPISRDTARKRQAVSAAGVRGTPGRGPDAKPDSGSADRSRRPKTTVVPGRDEGPSLLLSHSSFVDWELCPQLYRLRWVRKLAVRGAGCSGSAAEWGTAVHKGLAAWHRHGDVNVAVKAVQSHGFTPDGHLSSATAVKVLEEYIGHYGPSDECMHPRWVEREFTVPIGTVDGTNVHFAGTLDTVIVQNGEAVVVDHKTTGMGLPLWGHSQRVSAQWPGYTLGAQALTGLPCRKVVVNAISNRKDVHPRFVRFDVIVDDAMLEEWRATVLRHARDILESHRRSEWPLHRSSCGNQWSRPCEFFSVCELPCGSREKHLTRCADIVTRKPGPTERRIPMGLR